MQINLPSWLSRTKSTPPADPTRHLLFKYEERIEQLPIRENQSLERHNCFDQVASIVLNSAQEMGLRATRVFALYSHDPMLANVASEDRVLMALVKTGDHYEIGLHAPYLTACFAGNSYIDSQGIQAMVHHGIRAALPQIAPPPSASEQAILKSFLMKLVGLFHLDAPGSRQMS